jgi:predicted ribosomally synthesized peptide with nif11-like leader
MSEVLLRFHAMSEEQFTAFLSDVKDDSGLQEKLKGAADLDAAVGIAKEAGFDVSKADWLRHQAQQTLELSDEELDEVAGGFINMVLYPHKRTNCRMDSLALAE